MSRALSTTDLIARVRVACEKRRGLIERADLTAYRLLHGRADGVEGLVVERLGPVLIAQLHEEQLRLTEEQVRTAVAFFHERLGTRAVYRKFFVKDRSRAADQVEAEHRRPEPWIGETVEPEITIEEHGLRFIVRPYDGFSTGVFPEQRDNRRRIRELAPGRRVLNTFSYTCGFSVAAAAGGAVVDSVDASRRYLEWGKANFTANDVELGEHRFFASDVLEFFRRAERQGRWYDLIILDPPTFARLRRPDRTFVLDERLESLCLAAVGRLKPGGAILLATNHRGLTWQRLETALKQAGRGRSLRTEHLTLPCDFAGDPDYVKSFLASFAD